MAVCENSCRALHAFASKVGQREAKTHRQGSTCTRHEPLGSLSFLNTAIVFIHTLHSVNTTSTTLDQRFTTEIARFALCRRSRSWSQQAYRRLSLVDKL